MTIERLKTVDQKKSFQDRLKLVFGDNIPTQQELVLQLHNRLRSSFKPEVQEAAKTLLRELNRKEQFSALVMNREKYKGMDIETSRAKDLLALEQEAGCGGFLGKTFGYIIKKSGEQIAFDRNKKNKDGTIGLQYGDEILIDFGANSDANRRVGAGDIVPSNVNIIRVIDTNGNVRIGYRCINGSRVGYYDENNGYIAIFNGYKIQIPTNEEIKKPEMSEMITKFGISNVFEQNANKLLEIEKQEKIARLAYIQDIEIMRKSDEISDMIQRISRETIQTSSYKEKVRIMLERAKDIKAKQDVTYSSKILDLAIAQLEKTQESIKNLNVDFDWDNYKMAIANQESGNNYRSRNDTEGRRLGVDSEKWAFGKYQFTTSTLRGYGVELGRPPEEGKIQAFLNNGPLQEDIMDRYMKGNLEKYILPNQSIMAEVASGKSIEYMLALTHFGGPGALKNREGSDWMGRVNKNQYAQMIEDVTKKTRVA